MRAIGWLASTTALAAMVAFSRPASADSMDPALARLVTDASCQATGANPGKYYNPASGFARCGIDNLAFAKLVAQYGFAIAPSGMHSARTTGFGGFELAIEADYTKIDSSADYWKNGTQGADDTSTKKSSIRNPSPDSMLQVYNLKIRKGFPFGFELQGNVANMPLAGRATMQITSAAEALDRLKRIRAVGFDDVLCMVRPEGLDDLARLRDQL